MRVDIEPFSIEVEVRCPHCNDPMNIAGQFECNGTMIIELYPCAFCDNEDV